jgi:hypothetical protein
MMDVGFEGSGLDRFLATEQDCKHSLFFWDNCLEGQYGLEDAVSVSMLWTGS